MRKILGLFGLLMALFLSGCGISDNQVENDIHEVAISAGIDSLFLNDGTEKNNRSTEESFLIRGPLVKKEIIQNEYGQIVQIIDYDYDSKNRYSRVETSQYNMRTGNMELSLVDEYTYDNFFSYHTQTAMSGQYESSYEVRDTYNNTILLKVEGEQGSKTDTYTYDYTCDTQLRHEEYCYSGEGMNFSHYLVSLYNKNGDEISCVIQDSHDNYILYSTEYEYDSGNRILKKTETRTDEKSTYYTFSNETTVYINEYTYNDLGLLEFEIYTIIFNKDSYDESERVLKITYEYDSQNRLIKEVHEGTKPQIVLYEYDE